MNIVKAFMAGVTLPSIILPIGLSVMLATGKTELFNDLSIHLIPLAWGVWNVLYFSFFKGFLPENLDFRLLLTGAILGFLIAIYGVFFLHIPSLIGFPEHVYYAPLFALPLLYAILWRFIVKPLNDLVDLKDY